MYLFSKKIKQTLTREVRDARQANPNEIWYTYKKCEKKLYVFCRFSARSTGSLILIIKYGDMKIF